MRAFGGCSYLALTAVLAVVAMSGQAGAAEKQYVVGVSNTLIGNGWREEMVCSIKAEALASGKVSKVVLANRNGGPSEQIADLRNLISAGVNIIIVNPSDRKALDPVIKQATDRHIVVVAVDQAVSAPTAYVVANDQVTYGRLGAEALFKKLGGKGSVVEMRGIDGVPADADRHEGFTEAMKKYPDIKVVASVFTGWSPDKAGQQMKDLVGSGKTDRRRLDLGNGQGRGRHLQDGEPQIRAGGRRRQQRLHGRGDRPEGRRTRRHQCHQPARGRRRRPRGCARYSRRQKAAACHSPHPGSLQQHHAGRHGLAQDLLRSEGRSELPRVQRRQAVYELHDRAGEGVQGSGRMRT